MSKLIVVLGVTGNQGGSVAQAFLKDSDYRVRGVTRNASSPKAQELASQGIEIVQADLEDTPTIVSAFKGANVIFSVTNYWEPFFRPDCRAKAQAEGISCRRFAYDTELRQGKNIADAAATAVETLDENGFLVSTLSHGRKCSNGKYTELYHFDSKADVFPDYVDEKYPELAKKMSCIHTGYFTSSYNFAPGSYFRKVSEDTYEMRFTTTPDAKVPHLLVTKDTGPFVYAVSKLPPGKAYMAAGTTCSWSEYMSIWSRVTGKEARYVQISVQQMVDETADKDTGREIADMFEYSSDPGYDGGMNLLGWEDVKRDAGVELAMTSLDDWIKAEDWSAILSGPVLGPA